MAGYVQPNNNLVFKSINDLVIYQLGLIARTSSNILAQDGSTGLDATASFELSVNTLVDILITVHDDAFKKENESIKSNDAHKRFQACIKLIVRTGILRVQKKVAI